MICAVIVTYGTPAELAAAVASLGAQTHPPDEIVVVDNGASEGRPLPSLPELASARRITPASNLGFGAGCNLGAAAVPDADLLFLNADVVLTATAVQAMRRRLAADETAAVVGPRVLSGNQPQLSARSFPSLRTGVLGRRSLLTRMMVRAGRPPAEFRGAETEEARVDWVSGACMLIRREAFDGVDGFDEGYWMYWEDADLCRRLAVDGWSVHYERRAVVHHVTGASGTTERTIRAFHQSAARFAETHLARGAAGRALYRRMLAMRCWFALRAYRGRTPGSSLSTAAAAASQE
jgi:GT2 family glycosyltransferase